MLNLGIALQVSQAFKHWPQGILHEAPKRVKKPSEAEQLLLSVRHSRITLLFRSKDVRKAFSSM